MDETAIKYLDLTGLGRYDNKIKAYITEKDEERKVVSSDKTVTITQGSTTVDNGTRTTTNTNISVNIDGTTLVKDSTTGVISVASGALTQYVGDGEAISISNADQNNDKTISLEIDSTDKFLTKSGTSGNPNGLKVNLQIAKFDSAATSALGSNVKEAWALVDKNGNALTGTDNDQVIKVYKDSSLLDVELLHAVPATYYVAEDEEVIAGTKEVGDVKTAAVKPVYNNGSWIDIASASRTEANLAMCFAYLLADGTISVETIPVGSFLRESEFGNGLQVIDGNVSAKLDSNSEKDGQSTPVDFLSITSNGIKVQGIKEEIKRQIIGINPSTPDAAVTGKYVSAITIDSNGKFVVSRENLPGLSAGTDGTYFTTTVNGDTTNGFTVAGAISMLAVATSDSTDSSKKGVAEASDVKDYVDTTVSTQMGRLTAITNNEIDNLFT